MHKCYLERGYLEILPADYHHDNKKGERVLMGLIPLVFPLLSARKLAVCFPVDEGHDVLLLVRYKKDNEFTASPFPQQTNKLRI